MTDWTPITPPTGPDILDQNTLEFPCVEGVQYVLRFTVTGRTVGSVTASTGAALDDVTASANGTYTLQFTSLGTGTETVVFTPAGGFDGTEIDISLGEVNATVWTEVPDPSGSTSVITGYVYGLLMAITRPVTTTSDNWTEIGDPSTTWTTVPDPS